MELNRCDWHLLPGELRQMLIVVMTITQSLCTRLWKYIMRTWITWDGKLPPTISKIHQLSNITSIIWMFFLDNSTRILLFFGTPSNQLSILGFFDLRMSDDGGLIEEKENNFQSNFWWYDYRIQILKRTQNCYAAYEME